MITQRPVKHACYIVFSDASMSTLCRLLDKGDTTVVKDEPSEVDDQAAKVKVLEKASELTRPNKLEILSLDMDIVARTRWR